MKKLTLFWSLRLILNDSNKILSKNSSKIYTKFWSVRPRVRPKELCYLGPTHRLTLNLRLKIFTKLHDSTVAKIQNFPAWGGGYPPQQGRSQPHSPGWARVPLSSFFSSNFDQFILFFLKLYSFSSSFWFSGWAACPPGKALATPLLLRHPLPVSASASRSWRWRTTKSHPPPPPGVETDTPVNVNTHNRFQVI